MLVAHHSTRGPHHPGGDRRRRSMGCRSRSGSRHRSERHRFTAWRRVPEKSQAGLLAERRALWPPASGKSGSSTTTTATAPSARSAHARLASSGVPLSLKSARTSVGVADSRRRVASGSSQRPACRAASCTASLIPPCGRSAVDATLAVTIRTAFAPLYVRGIAVADGTLWLSGYLEREVTRRKTGAHGRGNESLPGIHAA